MMKLLLFVAALAILFKMLSAIAGCSQQKWAGRKMQFGVLTISYACMGAGAVGVAAGVWFGPHMLLMGVAGVLLTERRGM